MQERRLALGWRLVGYFVAWMVVMMLTNGLRPAPGPGMLWGTALSAVLYISGEWVMTYLFRRYVDRRPWAGLGLPLPVGRWGQMFAGALLAAAMIGSTFGVMLLLGRVRVTGIGTLQATWEPLLAWAVFHLAVGFAEELCFRGYLFGNLAERFPVWGVTVGSGLFFGVLHIEHAVSLWDYLVIIVAAAAVTTLFVVARLVTGSLWFPIACHAMWNWLEGHLLGLSGDLAVGFVQVEQLGPIDRYNPMLNLVELAMVLLAIAGLLLWARRKGRPVAWRAKLSAVEPAAA